MKLTIIVLAALLSFPSFAMQIFIKTPDGKTLTLDVDVSDSILSIKEQIEGKKGYAPSEQTLTYKTFELEDAKSLADYNVQKEETLVLTLRSSSSSGALGAPILGPFGLAVMSFLLGGVGIRASRGRL